MKSTRSRSSLVTVKITPETLRLAKIVAAMNDEKFYDVAERALKRELARVLPELRRTLNKNRSQLRVVAK